MLAKTTYEKCFNVISDSIIILNSGGGLLMANQAFYEKTGFTDGELRKNGFFASLFNDKQREGIIAKVNLCHKEPFMEYKADMIRKNGHPMNVQIDGSGFIDEGQVFKTLLIHDVSDQKAYEKVMSSSFDKFIQTTLDLDSAMKKIKEQRESLQEYQLKMKQELKVATTVQKAIIPSRFPNLEDFLFYGVSLPSEELGGDYFDYFLIDEEHIGLLLADVSGHGVPAALITTMIKAYFEYYSRRYLHPERVLYHVNQSLSAVLPETGFYLTAFYGLLNIKNHTLECCRAGHDAPLLVRKDASIEEAVVQAIGEKAEGTIIGAFADSEFARQTIQLEPESRIVIFTDGITEARGPEGEFFGDERMANYVKLNRNKSLYDFVNGLIDETQKFYRGKDPNDDRTIFAFDYTRYKAEEKTLLEAENLFRQKKMQEAYQKVDQLLHSDNPPQESLILAVKILVKLDKVAQAKDCLQKALAMDGASLDLRYIAGIVHFKLREYKKAAEHWEKAAQLDPEYKNLKNYLERVRKKLDDKDIEELS